ncbi:MAG: DNA polymerase III subunit gamma/tau, partial [Cyclobacteriaceae bacterium]|nr:DNA polymerase III subunit gamma/tau [Cyclobacteriaceae bacterium]
QINLSNSVQLEFFNEIKSDIATYLRKQLNNRGINIVSKIEEIKTEELLYTNKEKFEFLLSKNNSLRLMTEKFGLDPDY